MQCKMTRKFVNEVVIDPYYGAFTLGVRDSSIGSPSTPCESFRTYTFLPTYHKHFMLSYHSLNIKLYITHLTLGAT
jgi:hypothetical protein